MGKNTGESLRVIIDTLSLHMGMDPQKKILLVEGNTDKNFWINKISHDVVCFPVKNIRDPFHDLINNRVRTIPIKSKVELGNNKKAIVSIIDGIENFPPWFYHNCNQEIREWKLYGIVDADYQNPNHEIYPRNLCVTDTSDLETLLLSTDANLVAKQQIPEVDLQWCYFAAFYFARIKNILRIFFDQNVIYVDKILKSSNNSIPYKRFCSDNRFSLLALLRYICEGASKNWNDNVLLLLCNQIGQKDLWDDELISNKLPDEDDYVWNLTPENEIAQKKFPCFWNVINGHVLLNLIRIKSDNYAIDEKYLIDNYDVTCLYSSRIYNRLKQLGVTPNVTE